MKRRTVAIPVPPRLHLILINLQATLMSVVGLLTGFWPMKLYATLLMPWCIYAAVRHLWYEGEPFAFAIGTEDEPGRLPAAWPPEPGQCFICGCYDPQREAAFGDATHPDCRDWLGDWKPSGFITGGQARTLIPPWSGITMSQAVQALQASQDKRIILPSRSAPVHGKWITVMGRPDVKIPCTCGGKHYEDEYDTAAQRAHPSVVKGVLADFTYSWTCLCPVCFNHRSNLRIARRDHPNMCFCGSCEALSLAKDQRGPHHRNCTCTACYLNNPWAKEDQ